MPRGSSTDVAEAERPYLRMVAAVREQASIEAGMGTDNNTALELATKAIDRIAESDSWESILESNESGSLPGAEEAVGKGPLTFQAVSFVPSGEQYRGPGSIGVYAYIESITDNGDEFNWTTGATNVVMSLYRAQQLGQLSGARAKVVARGRAFLLGKA